MKDMQIPNMIRSAQCKYLHCKPYGHCVQGFYTYTYSECNLTTYDDTYSQVIGENSLCNISLFQTKLKSLWKL